jgi:Tol biopolymer transport system component
VWRTRPVATLAVTVLVVAACGSDLPADGDGDDAAAAVPIEEGVEPAADPAEPAMDDIDAWILYQGVFDGEVDLGLVRADGTEARRIAGGPGNRWHPDWSPDGTQIAYDHELPDGRGEIAVVGVDGRDDGVVVSCDHPCLGQAGPAWSPDGSSIGFDGYEGPTGGLEHDRCYLAILDLETDEVRRIFEWPGCDEDQDADDRRLSEGIYMRFSPDGARIVFQGEGPRGEWAVFTATVDGDEATQLTDWNGGARPDWSPDGEWIVFQGRENEHPDPQPGVAIHRIRPDGSEREQLTTPEGTARDYYPRWLPDGSAIIYSRCSDLWTCETRLVDPDGGNDRALFGELGRQTVHVMLQPPAGG